MKRFAILVPAALAALVTIGCGGHRAPTQTYRVPPRVNLAEHETIGVVEFSTTAKGELGALATRRFTEAARQDQGLVRMVDLDSKVMAGDPRALAALARDRGVRTILTGTLTVSEVKPDIRIATGLRSGSLSAKVDATLAVQLIETETGASIWSRSARATQTVGQVDVLGRGEFAFAADDPENAYGGLVDSLVAEVTRDFRSSWVRR